MLLRGLPLLFADAWDDSEETVKIPPKKRKVSKAEYDRIMAARAAKKAGGVEITSDTPKVDTPKVDVPSSESWIVGTGLDSDMSSDVSAGGGGVRFWMPPGSERNVIFLTDGDKIPIIWEHAVYLDGSWRNWFTCLQPLGISCGLCDYASVNKGKFRRSRVAFATIIDTHEFEDRAGKKHKNTKRLFTAKKDAADILKRKYKDLITDRHRLRGAMFKIYRSETDKSPSTGNDFTFKKMIDMDKIKDNEEFDYRTMLAPDVKRVKQVVARLKDEPTDSDIEEGATSDVEY